MCARVAQGSDYRVNRPLRRVSRTYGTLQISTSHSIPQCSSSPFSLMFLNLRRGVEILRTHSHGEYAFSVPLKLVFLKGVQGDQGGRRGPPEYRLSASLISLIFF